MTLKSGSYFAISHNEPGGTIQGVTVYEAIDFYRDGNDDADIGFEFLRAG